MALRGDFGALAALVAGIGKVADKSALRALSKQLAEEGLAQVREGFREERDPYGDRWAPLVARQGKILRDTGRLSNSFRRGDYGEDGFALVSNVVYAEHHQQGATIKSFASTAHRDRRGRFKSAKRKAARGDSSGALRSGGGRLPARPMVPIEGRGLGKIWGPAFKSVATAFVKRLVK